MKDCECATVFKKKRKLHLHNLYHYTRSRFRDKELLISSYGDTLCYFGKGYFIYYIHVETGEERKKEKKSPLLP
jgi:hypothetical protein